MRSPAITFGAAIGERAVGRRALAARAAIKFLCAARTLFVDFAACPRDISSRIAVVIESAWAMGISVAWVRAGGELQLAIGLLDPWYLEIQSLYRL